MKEYITIILQIFLLLNLTKISIGQYSAETVCPKFKKMDNYECVDTCGPNYFIFNKNCYLDSCPPLTKGPTYNVSDCQCKYKYIYVNKTYTCLDEKDDCPPEYPYIVENTRECSKIKCQFRTVNGVQLKTRKVALSNGNINYQCVSSCTNTEFIIQNKISDVETETSCIDRCPNSSEGTKIYYYPEKRECVDSCGKDFLYREKMTCHKKCETPLYTVTMKNPVSDSKVYCLNEDRCSKSENKYYYKSKNICVSSCLDTQSKLDFFGGPVETYVYEDDKDLDNKTCILDCSVTDKKLKSVSKRKCVKNCDNLTEFELNGACYTSCGFGETAGYPYVNESRHCIEKCPNTHYYYDGDPIKFCYKECPVDTYHRKDNNTCIIGCYDDKEKKLYYHFSNSTYNNTCFESECPDGYYHNDGEKICYAIDKFCNTVNNTEYKYMIDNPSSKICYKNCPGTEYKLITEDKVCLKSTTICPNNYIYKYGTVCYKNGCPPNLNLYNYIHHQDKDRICTANISLCDTKKLYVSQGECAQICSAQYPYYTEEKNKLSYCFSEPIECYERGFYYISYSMDLQLYKCEKTCDLQKYYEIEPDPQSNGTFPTMRAQGTCLEKCPNDYPYVDDINHRCYKNGCPTNLFYVPNNQPETLHYCKDKCNEGQYVYNNINCKNGIYNNNACIEGKQCIDDCKKTEVPFTDNIGGQSVCVNNCPQERRFYYNDIKICRDSCGEPNKTMVYNPDTGECISSCLNLTKTPYYPYFSENDYSLPCLAECPVYYLNETKECLPTCELKDKRYIYSRDTKMCLTNSCPKWEQPGELDNICKPICSYYFYRLAIDSNPDDYSVVCSSTCNFDSVAAKHYFLYSRSSNYECVDQCPIEENFLDVDKCVKECPENKNYLYRSGTFYVCVADCPSTNTEFIYHEGKLCVNKCQGVRPYVYKNTLECAEKCNDKYPYNYTLNGQQFCSNECRSGGMTLLGNQCVPIGKCAGNFKYMYDDGENRTCVEKCPDKKPLYVDNNGTLECMETCGDGKYISSNDRKCVDSCSDKQYVGKNRQCKDKCDPTEDGQFFFRINTNPIVYECFQRCNETYPYQLDNTFRCLSSCNGADEVNGYLSISSTSKACYTKCNINPNYPFSTQEDNQNVCAKSCLSNDKIYYGDKVCIDKSNNCANFTYNTTIDEFGGCVNKCHYEEGSFYKYQLDNKCVQSCSEDTSTPQKLYFSTNDYICRENCPNEFPYLRNTGECSKSCNQSSSYKYIYEGYNNKSKYTCLSDCDKSRPYYYEGEYICYNDCTRNGVRGYLIEGTKKCVDTCANEKEAKYIYSPLGGNTNYTQYTCVFHCLSTNKPFTLEDNQCDIRCSPTNGYKYYLPSQKICLKECPAGTKEDPENPGACINQCKDPSPFLLETGICASECDNTYGYLYYLPNEKVCLRSCGKYYHEENSYVCLEKCPETGNIFVVGNVCTSHCPVENKYYIEEFKNNEPDKQKKCYSDCPNEYPFVYTKEVNNIRSFSCRTTCSGTDKPYFVFDQDSEKVARECLDKCSDPKPFIGFDNECVKQCPSEKPYYFKEAKGIKCYDKCPAGYFIKNNTFECVTTCGDPKYQIDGTNLCLDECYPGQYWARNNTNRYCLDQCGGQFGNYITPDKECVTDCGSKYDNTTGSIKCTCKGLYYINEITDKTYCLEDSLEKADSPHCKSKSNLNSVKYYYIVSGTNQCIQYCNTLLTLDYSCLQGSSCPENSEIYYTNNKEYSYHGENVNAFSVCKCKYKFYKENNIIICLGKNDKCPDQAKYLKESTNECVKCENSPNEYQFNDLCVDKCSDNGQTINGHECKCSDKWYKEKGENNKNKQICLSNGADCPLDLSLLRIDYKECVSKCSDSDFIYGTTCRTSCDPNTTEGKNSLSSDNPFYGKADKECRCKNVWYIDKNNNSTGITCESSSDQQCITIANQPFKFEIAETKQCVSSCPTTQPYMFSNKCYRNCSEADKLTNSIKLIEGTYQCECSELWYKFDTYNIKCKGQCCPDNYLEIKKTKECIIGGTCPQEYPLLFNNSCYAKDSCPINSHYDISLGDKCICDNLFYENKTEEGDCVNFTITTCLPLVQRNCSVIPQTNDSYFYEISDTKKCTSLNECISFNYSIFNYKCYNERCPDKSVEKTNFNEYKQCICNELYGYWYQYKDNSGHTYYECGLTECPTERIWGVVINGKETKECVKKCFKDPDHDHNYYLYKSKCYDVCPESVLKNEETHQCFRKELNSTDLKLEEAQQLISGDLAYFYREYGLSNPTKSFVNKNLKQNAEDTNPVAALQIFSINKYRLDDLNAVKDSGLSFVNITECLDKLYSYGGLGYEDNIIVVKYDRFNSSQYWINPVEYEFYSSLTFQKIDTAICEVNKISISYPTKENPIGKQRLELAKKLLQESKDKDIFNSSSPIYQDYCITCEVDGKDLTLEDRRNYLYPPISACENNCTLQNIDYSNGTINCVCKPKIVFDLSRIDKSQNFEVQDYSYKQNGPSNIPVVTCMKKMTDNLSSNAAFYFMCIVLVGEVVTVFISVFVGFPHAIKNIQANLGNIANPPKYNDIQASGDEEVSINDIEEYVDTNNAMNNANNRKQSDNNYQQQKNQNYVNNDGKLSKQNKGSNQNQIQSSQRAMNSKPKEKMKMYDDNNNNDTNANNQKSSTIDEKGCLSQFRIEQGMFKIDYNTSKRQDKYGYGTVIFASIFDKFIIVRIIIFLKKYDILAAYLTLYFFYHAFLLVIITLFYDVSTIHKIWNNNGYPDAGFHLLYGLLGHIIVWIIYKFIECLISTHNDKIRSLEIIRNNETKRRIYMEDKDGNFEDVLKYKYNKIMQTLKRNLIIFYILIFVFSILFFLYLVVFCAIYTGTKKRLFATYGYSMIEMFVIKMIYGAVTGALRRYSLNSKSKLLYKIVRFLNVYVC